MAKQIGEIRITGTVAGITFYRMEGQYYARRKSRLRGERVKRAKEFARTMQSARRLGRGSQLASQVYRSLPRTAQVYALFCTLKRRAIGALKEGRGEDEVMELLRALVGTKGKSGSTRDKVQRTRVEGAVAKKSVKTEQWPHIARQLGVDAGGRLVGEEPKTDPFCPVEITVAIFPLQVTSDE